LDQVWLAARACDTAANVISQTTAHVLSVLRENFFVGSSFPRPGDTRDFEGVDVFIAGCSKQAGLHVGKVANRLDMRYRQFC